MRRKAACHSSRYGSPPSKSARTALMATVTGWFWANGCSQQGLSGDGTRA
jgi:hypothetical protein